MAGEAPRPDAPGRAEDAERDRGGESDADVPADHRRRQRAGRATAVPIIPYPRYHVRGVGRWALGFGLPFGLLAALNGHAEVIASILVVGLALGAIVELLPRGVQVIGGGVRLNLGWPWYGCRIAVVEVRGRRASVARDLLRLEVDVPARRPFRAIVGPSPAIAARLLELRADDVVVTDARDAAARPRRDD